MSSKKDEKIIDKVIIERKFKNELTPIQAILPLVIEEIERKRKQYIKEQSQEFKK